MIVNNDYLNQMLERQMAMKQKQKMMIGQPLPSQELAAQQQAAPPAGSMLGMGGDPKNIRDSADMMYKQASERKGNNFIDVISNFLVGQNVKSERERADKLQSTQPKNPFGAGFEAGIAQILAKKNQGIPLTAEEESQLKAGATILSTRQMPISNTVTGEVRAVPTRDVSPILQPGPTAQPPGNILNPQQTPQTMVPPPGPPPPMMFDEPGVKPQQAPTTTAWAGIGKILSPGYAPGYRQEQEETGRNIAKEGQDVRDQAAAAAQGADQIRAAMSLDFEGGTFSDAAMDAINGFRALGINVSDDVAKEVTDQRTFKGIMSDLVLSKQIAQKGPQTDSDAKRMEATLARTTDPRQARDMILRYQLALSERIMQKADQYNQFESEHGGTQRGANAAWREYVRKNPLVYTDKETGQPTFMNEYMDNMREKYPDESDDAILEAWRKLK